MIIQSATALLAILLAITPVFAGELFELPSDRSSKSGMQSSESRKQILERRAAMFDEYIDSLGECSDLKDAQDEFINRAVAATRIDDYESVKFYKKRFTHAYIKMGAMSCPE